ncbi:hypothetical protein GLOTRDRAFT_130788 [Gloeophyllum trabeum ATCC 11539]|uniref:DUF6534 domain-containing protein n=1 Tax=Gloeophyllum trabeum (strain ATCC 11539 / FP-39264 / Madison 617) TaxID=670483 RepID=S7Q131_GLOTA|nr:uncharacterized protein GLOTRDRAFT_130788 [Gloeophyllum trabeum ATCC 11539]EPQ53453.1 hypothetical protein GLOTRDRAFT_130788 [Gloeophyllum trabeum ATCC 11539]
MAVLQRFPFHHRHGPSLIGLFFNILLYGIMITQTFLYFHAFPNDRRWIKLFVSVLFLADTVNSIFDCVFIYQAVIIHFGDDDFVANANWVFATDPAMTGIIAAMVQLFFAWRIKILTGNNYLVGIVIVAAITGMFGGLGTAVAIKFVPKFIEFQRFEPVVIVWLIGNAICDIIITSVLTWHLRRHRTGFPATDDIVNKIIRLTVQTGMLTCIVALFDTVFFVASSSGIHIGFNFPLSKLYTNSLMSTLNSRTGWKYNRTTEPSGEESGAVSGNRGGRNRKVFVTVESHQMVDMDNKTGAITEAEDDVDHSTYHQERQKDVSSFAV